MMTRQILSIFLSGLLFNHQFTANAYIGVGVVAAALLLKIYLGEMAKRAQTSDGGGGGSGADGDDSGDGDVSGGGGCGGKKTGGGSARAVASAATDASMNTSDDEFDEEAVEQLQQQTVPKALQFNSPGRKANLSVFVEGARRRKAPARFVAKA
jgi:hypothetical protein